jgi:hypothetical protein
VIDYVVVCMTAGLKGNLETGWVPRLRRYRVDECGMGIEIKANTSVIPLNGSLSRNESILQ